MTNNIKLLYKLFFNHAMNNIKVCVRLRPLPASSTDSSKLIYSISQSNQSSSLLVRKVQTTKEFRFDYIYDDQVTNDIIYENSVVNIINSCFRGYNATIFAYGQSGSGKTFTMGTCGGYSNTLSSKNNSVEEGIIPRTLIHIFNIIENDQVNRYRMFVSFIEIYNDEFIDLLCPAASSDSSLISKDIVIREDNSNNIQVTGMKELYLMSIEDAFAALEKGNAKRKTAETMLNEVSSRSHAIFTLNMEIFQPLHTANGVDNEVIEGKFLYSKLHLVDLAGSERTKKSGAVGVRLKESVGINQGLLSLGRVIRALTAHSVSNGAGTASSSSLITAHIPYRESKLTRFLQDSLGGNSQTLMFACVSVDIANLTETLSTLEYAAKARLVHNKSVANVVMKVAPPPVVTVSAASPVDANTTDLVESLRAQVISMKQEITALQSNSETSRDMRLLEEQVKPLVTQLSARLQGAVRWEEGLLRDTAALVQHLLDFLSSSSSSSSSYPTNNEFDSELWSLRRELEECRSDLARDEVLYAQKVAELRGVERRLRSSDKERLALQKQLAQLTSAVGKGGMTSPSRQVQSTVGALHLQRETLRAETDYLASEYRQARSDLEACVRQHTVEMRTFRRQLGKIQDDIQTRRADMRARAGLHQRRRQLSQTYSGRMVELEQVILHTREELQKLQKATPTAGAAATVASSRASTASSRGGEEGELRSRLERAEDELAILNIRYEQQYKDMQETSSKAEDATYEEDEAMRTALHRLKEEEIDVQRVLAEKEPLFDADISGRREELREIERLMGKTAAELADIEQKIRSFQASGGHGVPEEMKRGEGGRGEMTGGPLLDKYSELIQSHYYKSKFDLLNYVNAIDSCTDGSFQTRDIIERNDVSIESLQRKYEIKVKNKSEIEDEIFSLESLLSIHGEKNILQSSHDRLEDARQALAEVDAELDLLKLQLIETSRRRADASYMRENGDADADVSTGGGGTQLHGGGSIPVLEREVSNMDSETCRQLVLLLTRIVLDQRDNCTLNSPVPFPFSSVSAPSSPSKIQLTSPMKDIDISVAVKKWKSESLRRKQLENRNSELLREIRGLRESLGS